jgi:DNA-binding SARP family transcriptional activator
MKFRLLGPLEVWDGKRAIAIGGPKQRAVLAHLLLHGNEVVATEKLIDDIWGETPPEAARNSLQTYISLLRKAMGDGGRIEARPPGYVIHLKDDELDALRFEQLVSDARGRLGADPSAALRGLADALALWTGTPLADPADEPSFRAEISRLEDLHAAAVEDHIAAELASGNHARIIGELENLVRRNPLRERLWAHLIVALYRSSRQADALEAYTRLRGVLADELGIDPSPELKRLHEQVLAQDPGLDLRGQALRGYRLLEQIGEGSFGIVYRAIQPQVDRDVAVKVVRPRLANDPDFIRRFESEAQMVARLEHPHIVPLYDYWREPDAAYLVMRLLRGGSLKERIAKASLDPDEVARLLEQVCSAIATAHRQGIVHRDVKPANILLDADGTAYLSDFGIAWRPEQEDRPDEFPTRADICPPSKSAANSSLRAPTSTAWASLSTKPFAGDLPSPPTIRQRLPNNTCASPSRLWVCLTSLASKRSSRWPRPRIRMPVTKAQPSSPRPFEPRWARRSPTLPYPRRPRAIPTRVYGPSMRPTRVISSAARRSRIAWWPAWRIPTLAS